MTSPLNIEMTFPTVFGFQDNFLSDEENNLIIEKCYEINSTIDDTNNGWLSSDKSPKNSLLSHNLTKNSDFSFFFNKLDQKIREFSQANNDYEDYVCHGSWFNIYKKDNYQEPHAHFMTTYSAVYFPRAPEGSGKLIFLSPLVNELGGSSPLFPTSSDWSYEPRDKLLIVFRSNIRHYVLHGSNNEDRISIASNYAVSPESYARKFI